MVKKEFPKLDSKIVLAPMHGITNVAFRLMCKKYGASLTSTELLSANAFVREKNVLRLALCDKSEKPVVVQIFGQNTENLVKTAQKLENHFDMINLNLGCPSKKIMTQGSGGALMKRKNKVKEIVDALVRAVKIPVTVKIRSGFDDKINAVEISKICEKAGVSAVIVHARTVEQGRSGKADWSVIREVKEAVEIPIIGNGDVWVGEDAKRMLEETGCDYVMVGRAAIGNPFIFKEINKFLDKGEVISQSKEDKIADFFEYIKLCKRFNIFSVNDAKLRAQDFTKGLHGSSNLRKELNKVKEWSDIERSMKGLLES